MAKIVQFRPLCVCVLKDWCLGSSFNLAIHIMFDMNKTKKCFTNTILCIIY